MSSTSRGALGVEGDTRCGPSPGIGGRMLSTEPAVGLRAADEPARRFAEHQRSGALLVAAALVALVAPVAPDKLHTYGVWLAPLLLLRLHRLQVLDLAVFALATWASVTALDVVWFEASDTAVWAYWGMAVVFTAVRGAVERWRDVIVVGAAYLAGSVYAAVRTIQQGRTLRLQFEETVIRAGIDGVNPNYTAYALATAVAVAVVLLRSGQLNRWGAGVVWSTLPVLGWAVFLTGTRGAQVAVGFVLAYLAASRVAAKTAWITVAVGAPILLVVVPAGWYGDERLLWFERFFARQDETLSGRLDVWEIARNTWAEHWWSGIGVGAFPISNPFGIGAHSVVLTVLVEMGVVGAVLYAGVFIAALTGPARSGPVGRQMVGVLVLAWLPIWLTGHWELAPAAWLVLAVWSRLPHPAVPLHATERPGGQGGGQDWRALTMSTRSGFSARDRSS